MTDQEIPVTSEVAPAKPWYKSKTIWLMVSLVVVTALPAVQPAIAAFVTPDTMTKIQAVLDAVIAILGIINRVLSTSQTPIQ